VPLRHRFFAEAVSDLLHLQHITAEGVLQAEGQDLGHKYDANHQMDANKTHPLHPICDKRRFWMRFSWYKVSRLPRYACNFRCI
jgi:hypothetical protein